MSPTCAGSAHFIGNLTKASLDGTSLVVQFKEAGLESGSVETVVVQAHLDATYQCINNGGTNPPDAKKTTFNSEVSKSGTYPANKNSQSQGSPSTAIPSAASVLSCPGGQTATNDALREGTGVLARLLTTKPPLRQLKLRRPRRSSARCFNFACLYVGLF